MIRLRAGLALAALLGLAGAALAGPVAIRPAAEQPAAAELRPGLAVTYAFPTDVRSLYDAEQSRNYRPTKGKPLVGFDYPDTASGENALTSDQAEKVVAYISGLMRFEKAGVYRLSFQSNDGLRVILGGAQVYEHDGRHACVNSYTAEVSVPEPGWYPVEALWFQRLSTSCLLLRWQPPGGAEDWAPNAIFAHRGG